MAYALDVANVGNNTGDGGGASPDLTLTTGTTVTAGARIFVVIGHDSGGSGTLGTHTMTGGGLTWNEVGTGQDSSGSQVTSFFYADAPSGLASSTVLTWATTGTVIWTWQMAASSYTGSGWTAIGTADVNSSPGASTWISDSTALNGNSILISGATGRNSASHTATNGTEDQDRAGGGYVNTVIVRRFETTTASFQTGGTWSATTDGQTAVTAAWKENGAAPEVRGTVPRRMPIA